MINPTIKELAKTRAKVAQLEQALTKELASLPATYGFDSLKAFIAAINDAANGTSRPARKPVEGTARRARKRATITDATRAQLRQLVKAGKTGSQIAKALGISLPSVQNIKKALGLVRSSEKAAVRPKAKRAPAPVKSRPKNKKKRTAPRKSAAAVAKPSQPAVEPAPAPGT
jgi:hypothetical protein